MTKDKKQFQGPEGLKRSIRVGEIIAEVIEWPEEDTTFLINDLIEILPKTRTTNDN